MTTVLIIEDNEDNLILITRLLEKSGYQTYSAETGEGGYELALEKGPDFILLDIQLPDMNSIQVLEKLRENLKTKSIPVIAITSSTMAGDREQFLAAGCNGYLEKPIDPLGVVDQIKKILHP